MTIINCTITENWTTGWASGIFITGGASVTLTNSIVWNNDWRRDSSRTEEIQFGSYNTPNSLTVSHSNIQGGQAAVITYGNGTLTWLGGNINANPLFVDAANGDYHLSNDSPCLGAGAITNAPETGIEGNPRPYPVDSDPDMGAYENEPAGPAYIVTAAAGDNGNITPAGQIPVPSGTNQAFTITPDDHYSVADVLVDGESVGALNEYTFEAVTADHTISVTFVLASFTIAASSEGNGSVSPVGVAAVTYGSSQTYTIAPDACYYIADVLVDGESVGAVTEYTFTDVRADHTIAVTFEYGTGSGKTVAVFSDLDVPSPDGVFRRFGPRVVVELRNRNIAAKIVDTAGLAEYMRDNPDGIVLISHAHLPSNVFTNNPGSDLVYSWLMGGGTLASTGDQPFYYYWDGTLRRVGSDGQRSMFGTAVTAGSIRTVRPTALGESYMSFDWDSWQINRGVSLSVLSQNGFEYESYADDGAYGDPVAFRTSDMQGWFINFYTSCCGINVPSSDQMAIEFANLISNRFVDESWITSGHTTVSTSGENGSISPADAVSVSCDGSQTFTIAPDSCYKVADVLVDGSSVGPVTEYTFTNIEADHTIAVTFEMNSFTVTATAGENGSISPAGVVNVVCGENQIFTITPADCYQVADVLVDGESVGPVTEYTFANVETGHTIAATFERSSFEVTATAAENGSISPAGVVDFTCGQDQIFTITPADCYQVVDVLVDGSSVGAVTEYTFENVSSDHTISATFLVKTSTITATAGNNGSISPADEITVGCGEDQVFRIRPNEYYHVVDVLVDGESVGAITQYTFQGVTSDHTVSAAFAMDVIVHVDNDNTSGPWAGTPENPYRYIQDGIDAAAEGNTVLVLDGIYTGPGNVNLDFGGKNLIVRSMNGPENCIIDCENTSNTRGFYFYNGESLDSVVMGFTIRNGRTDRGGAIYCDGASATIIGNIIIDNSASYAGGGIYCNGSTMILRNNVFARNFAASYGGGISCWYADPPLAMANNTFTENSAGIVGGAVHWHFSSSTVTNSIFWNNTPQSLASYAQGASTPSVITISFSNVQGRQREISDSSSVIIEWLDGNIDADPMFVDAANGDYHLSNDSPCLGTGTFANAPEMDIDGNLRPAPAGSVPDMGAYENSLGLSLYAGPLWYISTNGSDTNNGSVEFPFATIQRGIDTSSDSHTVLVADGIYTGPGNVNLDFSGRAIIVRSANGPEDCIIDCENINGARGFIFRGGEGPNSIVQGFTIRNGNATGLYPNNRGGAILCDSSSPTIIGNILIQNSATDKGGGIFCSGDSAPTIAGNIIKANSAGGNGGGIGCYKADPTIEGNTIVGNSATLYGAGISCYGGAAEIINNTIADNTAENGAGLYCSGEASPQITNNIFTGNVANSNGGSIFCYDGSRPVVTNTILWDNAPQEVYFSPFGNSSTITISHSDVKGGKPELDNGTLNWSDSNISADPLFVDAANGDYSLYDSSPCIGTGTGSDARIGAFSGTRGIRLYSGPLWYVSTGGNDANNGSAEYPFSTIQQGINAANDGDTVLVADGKYAGKHNTNLDFSGKAITVKSENGAADCIIDCEGSSRGFYFHSGETPDSVVDGFTIRDGRPHGGFPADSGGGILIVSSSPTISNNIILENSAEQGGGIFCYDRSAPIITRNTIMENSAHMGGGIKCTASSSPKITDNIIKENTAREQGGGIHCDSSSAPVIARNTIEENSVTTAGGSGGGIYCDALSLNIMNITNTDCSFK